MELKVFQEQCFFMTARIISIGKQPNDVSLGTGFLVKADLGVDDKQAIFLVSNKHVLIDPARQFIVEFTRADTTKDPVRPALGEKVKLSGDFTKPLFYFEHPRKEVDLACVNMVKIAEPELRVYYRTMTMDIAATFTEGWMLPNRDVIFIGYPEGLYDSKNNLPLLRRGVIASIPKVDFEGESQFLVDAQVFNGSSGSPVFVSDSLIGGNIKVVGVITAAMMKHSKVVSIPTATGDHVAQMIGLGIVLKPVLVREMIDAAAKQISEALVKEKNEKIEALVVEGEASNNTVGAEPVEKRTSTMVSGYDKSSEPYGPPPSRTAVWMARLLVFTMIVVAVQLMSFGAG